MPFAPFTNEPARGTAKIVLRDAASVTVMHAELYCTEDGSANQGLLNFVDRGVWEGTAGQARAMMLFVQMGAGIQPMTYLRAMAFLPGTTTQVGATRTFVPVDNGTTRSYPFTLHFDADPFDETHPINTGRWGMVELVIEAGSTGGLDPWAVNSRAHLGAAGGGLDDVPAGIAASSHFSGRGYMRSRAIVSAFEYGRTRGGDGTPSGAPLAYGDPLRIRATLDVNALPYETLIVTHEVFNGSTVIRSKAEISGAAAIRDVDFEATSGLEARVHNGGPGTAAGGAFPVGLAPYALVQPAADFGGDNKWAWAAAGSLAPWTPDPADVRRISHAGVIDADPRLTLGRLVQVNVNAFATPPQSICTREGSKYPSDLGYVASRVTNARGEGVNQAGGASLGISYSLADEQALTVPIATVTDQPTATAGGEAGWGPLMAWAASTPPGRWLTTVTFRDPAGVQVQQDVELTMLFVDPRVRLAVGGGSAGNQKNHFMAGQPLVVAQSLIDVEAGKLVDAALIEAGSALVALCRLNLAVGRAEYLRGDNTWQPIGTGAVEFFPLTQSPTDAGVWTRTFSAADGFDTSGWGDYDLIVVGEVRKLLSAGAAVGTPFASTVQVPVLGAANPHAQFQLDPTGMFK